MNRFKTPDPTPTCAFPKPVRQKRRVVRGADAPTKTAGHNDVLFACVEVLQQAYPEYGFLHIPDSLYSLISIDGDLCAVLASSLGQSAALGIKQEIGDAIKGVADLVVWSPQATTGIRLSMIGEIKVGADRIRKAQRNWAKGEIKVWATVEDFKMDMVWFSTIYEGMVAHE